MDFRGSRDGDEIRATKYKYFTYLLLGFISTLFLVSFKKMSYTKEYVDTFSMSGICKNLTYCKCPFTFATTGKWMQKSNITSPWLQEDIKTIRRKLNLPENMTREDGRCGIDAPIPNSRLPALCEPDSHIYCCNEKTASCGGIDHCKKHESFNTRTKIPLSQASWIPEDKSCYLKLIGREEACTMLNESVSKIVFLGDEQARHFYTTLVLFLSGNYKNGAIQKSKMADKYAMENCTYEYQLINRRCRHDIVKTAFDVDNWCNGNYEIDLEYFADYKSYLSKETIKMMSKLKTLSNSYVILGAGTHFNSDHTSFLNYYLRPMIERKLFTKGKSPRLTIELLHKVYSAKSNAKRLEFNERVVMFSRAHPVMSLLPNTLLTDNLESHDGRAYGLKYNMLKVQILLHHLHNANLKCNC